MLSKIYVVEFAHAVDEAVVSKTIRKLANEELFEKVKVHSIIEDSTVSFTEE